MNGKMPVIIVVQHINEKKDEYFKFKILIGRPYLCGVYFGTPLSQWSEKMTPELAQAQIAFFGLKEGGLVVLADSEEKFFLTMLVDIMSQYRDNEKMLDAFGEGGLEVNDLYQTECDIQDVRRFLV